MRQCAALLAAVLIAVSAHAGAIVCDHDLTQNGGGDAVVTGGTYQNGGWVGTGGGRVLYTSPEPMRKGWAEVSFFVDDISTSLQDKNKCIFFAIYDCSGLSQSSCAMKAYVRIRKESDRPYYLEFKARDIKQLHGEGETRLYNRDDWENYYGDEVHIKFMWGPDMIITMEYPNQSGSGYSTVKRGDYNITDIKYVVVGAENSYNCTFTGFRYTGLTVYDEDASATPVVGGTTPLSPVALSNYYRVAGNSIVFDLAQNETAAIYDLKGTIVRIVTPSAPSLPTDALSSGRYMLSVNGASGMERVPLMVR